MIGSRTPWPGTAYLRVDGYFGLFVGSGPLALVVYFIAGTRGIPPVDDVTDLDGPWRALGWLAFVLLVLLMLPVPQSVSSALGLHGPYL